MKSPWEPIAPLVFRCFCFAVALYLGCCPEVTNYTNRSFARISVLGARPWRDSRPHISCPFLLAATEPFEQPSAITIHPANGLLFGALVPAPTWPRPLILDALFTPGGPLWLGGWRPSGASCPSGAGACGLILLRWHFQPFLADSPAKMHDFGWVLARVLVGKKKVFHCFPSFLPTSTRASTWSKSSIWAEAVMKNWPSGGCGRGQTASTRLRQSSTDGSPPILQAGRGIEPDQTADLLQGRLRHPCASTKPDTSRQRKVSQKHGRSPRLVCTRLCGNSCFILRVPACLAKAPTLVNDKRPATILTGRRINFANRQRIGT